MSYMRVSGTDKNRMTSSTESSSDESTTDTVLRVGDKAVSWWERLVGGAKERYDSSGRRLPSPDAEGSFLSQSVAGVPLWMILAGAGAVIILKRRG